MAVVPTATEVIEEGQLQIGQFPTCANQGAFDTLVGTHIARAHIQVKKSAPELVNKGT